MATLDDLCETLDEFAVSGDAPLRFKYEGLWLDVGAISKEPDGSVTLTLEDADEEGPTQVGYTRTASIHWGGDGV